MKNKIKSDILNFVKTLNAEFIVRPDDTRSFDVEFGSKFAKIIYVRGGSYSRPSAWGFVSMKDMNFKGEEIKTGDLLKTASWKAPAKGRRGSILDGTAQYGEFGVKYKNEITEDLDNLALKQKMELV